MRAAALLWAAMLLLAPEASAQPIEAGGPHASRGRFAAGLGASMVLHPQVTFRPTLDLAWTKDLGDSHGLSARLSIAGTFNFATFAARRTLLRNQQRDLELVGHLELFGELSMGSGDRVEVAPVHTFMRPLVGIAPGVSVCFGRSWPSDGTGHLDTRWVFMLDVPIALPGATGVTTVGRYSGATWAQPYLRPTLVSESALFGTLSLFSMIQVWLEPKLVAPVVSVGLAY